MLERGHLGVGLSSGKKESNGEERLVEEVLEVKDIGEDSMKVTEIVVHMEVKDLVEGVRMRTVMILLIGKLLNGGGFTCL